MNTIAEKMSYLNETKQKFKNRINSLGGEITDSTSFRNYLNWLDTFYEDASNKTDLSTNGIVGRTNQETTTGKNLLGLSNYSYSSNGVNCVVNNGIITLNGTATANAFIRIALDSFVFDANTYTLSANNTNTLSSNDLLRFVNANGVTVGNSLGLNIANASQTMTFNTTTDTLNLQIRIENGTTVSNFVIKPQIELGNSSTNWEPYTGNQPSPSPDYPQPINNLSGDVSYKITTQDGEQTFILPLGDIELCKIDTYEDKIYSNNGRFYLAKNINSTIINGTEPNFIADNKPSELTYYSYNLYNNNFVMPSSVCYCDKLLYSENSLYSNDIQGIKPTSTGRIKIKVFDSSLSTVDLFKAWLSNNNLLMYYIQPTTTITEITEENYPSLYNVLKQIQDYLTAYKINKEFILNYDELNINY